MAENPTKRVALLSIHPRHAESILGGTKKVELRRTPVSNEISLVLLYATAPVRAVVGWFAVAGIDSGSKSRIWETHSRVAGITRDEYRSYFAGANRAFAIQVGETSRLKRAVDLDKLPSVSRAPQSFQYLKLEDVDWLFQNE